jgi:hypothetical protein
MIFFLWLFGCTKTAEYCVERKNNSGEVTSAQVTKMTDTGPEQISVKDCEAWYTNDTGASYE